jgi:hypothetical protein
MPQWTQISRRYNDLCSDGTEPFTPSIERRLRVWLEDDVIPSLTELTTLPRFRDLATFSIRVLAPGVDSEQRRAVEDVDRGLTNAANALLAVVDHPSIFERLPRSTSSSIPVKQGSVEINSHENGKVVMSPGSLRENPELEIAALRRVARHDEGDLVQLDDYFSTRQEFVVLQDGTRLQRGELINSLNPRLLAIGDLVGRTLRHRINLRLQAIHSVRTRINQLLTAPVLSELDVVSSFRRTDEELQTSVRRLEALVFTDSEAHLRDSCVTLTQVYTALHTAPELEWLGIREELLAEARGLLPSVLRGHRGSVVHDRIARAVADMDILYRGIDPCSTRLELAIQSGGLVIDMQGRSAWWDRTQIELGNSVKNFKFLSALARKTRRRQDLIEDDVYDDDQADSPSPSALANLWSRVGRILPGSLSQLIGRGRQPRSYRLNLEPHRIHWIE